jgi:hypothetical protein
MYQVYRAKFLYGNFYVGFVLLQIDPNRQTIRENGFVVDFKILRGRMNFSWKLAGPENSLITGWARLAFLSLCRQGI